MTTTLDSPNRIADRGELTRDEVHELAERTAQALLGVSAEEAFAMLERGELAGTAAEGPLLNLRWLLNE